MDDFTYRTLIFWYDLFLVAREKILAKISLVFWVDLLTTKRHFEINWPLLVPYKNLGDKFSRPFLNWCCFFFRYSFLSSIPRSTILAWKYGSDGHNCLYVNWRGGSWLNRQFRSKVGHSKITFIFGLSSVMIKSSILVFWN